MTDRASIEALLDKLYAARIADDVDAMMACIDDKATMRQPADPCWGSHFAACEGATDIRSAMKMLVEAWDFVELERLTTLIDGDKAAVHSRLKARFKPTGKVVDTELYDLWTIKGGKVTAMVEFTDTAMINAMIADLKAA